MYICIYVYRAMCLLGSDRVLGFVAVVLKAPLQSVPTVGASRLVQRARVPASFVTATTLRFSRFLFNSGPTCRIRALPLLGPLRQQASLLMASPLLWRRS